MEYLRVNALLPVLVLDRWFCEFACRIHIPYVWRLFPDLLHNHRISCCIDESHGRDRRSHVFSAFFICPYIVSHSLGELVTGTANHNVYSDGVLQPFRLLGWWQWMYRLSPFTYLIEALVGQGAFINFFRNA